MKPSELVFDKICRYLSRIIFNKILLKIMVLSVAIFFLESSQKSPNVAEITQLSKICKICVFPTFLKWWPFFFNMVSLRISIIIRTRYIRVVVSSKKRFSQSKEIISYDAIINHSLHPYIIGHYWRQSHSKVASAGSNPAATKTFFNEYTLKKICGCQIRASAREWMDELPEYEQISIRLDGNRLLAIFTYVWEIPKLVLYSSFQLMYKKLRNTVS